MIDISVDVKWNYSQYLYPQLFVGGIMSYLSCLCLFRIVVSNIVLSFSFVVLCLCTLCYNLSIMWMLIVVMVCHTCLLQICSNGLWNCFDIVVWTVFHFLWKLSNYLLQAYCCYRHFKHWQLWGMLL
jgi:hypothetical protein